MRKISNGDQSFTLRIPIDVDRTEACPTRAIALVVQGDDFVEAGTEPHPDGYRCGGTTILTIRGFRSEETARVGFERVLHAFATMHADRHRRAYVHPILDAEGAAVTLPDEHGNPVPARMFSSVRPILFREFEHVVLDGAFSIDPARTTDFEFVERIKQAPVGALRYPKDALLIAACGMSAAASIASPGVNIVLLTTILEMLSDLPENERKKYQYIAGYLTRAAGGLSDESSASGAIAAHGLTGVVEAIYDVRNSYAHRGVWTAAENGMHPNDVLATAFEIARTALLHELRTLGDGRPSALG